MSTPADLRETVHTILRRHLPGLADGEPLPDDRSLAELGLTSLRSVDLVLDLEDALGVMLPDKLLVVQTFQSAASLTDAIAELVLVVDVSEGRS